MTSIVDICNLALSNIRAGSINNLNEGSLQAQVCSLKYSFMRDRLLTETAWGFNRKIRVLSVVDIDIFNWAYAYQYPVDCLKINRLIGEYEQLSNSNADVVNRLIDTQILPIRDVQRQVEYEVFNFDNKKTIGSNEACLRMDYSAKISDPDLFTTDFILALSHLLASELAIPIIGAETGRALRGDEVQLYRQYLSAALANDTNEQYNTLKLSEFETIRR